MDGTILVRLGAVVFVALVVTAALVDYSRDDTAPSRLEAGPSAGLPDDPLRAEQRRCQLLGQAAADDPACLRVWSLTRDRFLGRGPDVGQGR